MKLTKEDRLTLKDVRIFPRIGVTQEERLVAQECRADLTLYGSFEAAALSDCLDSSVDYCRILDLMQEIAASGEYALVETLAYKIAGKVLDMFPGTRVCVRVRKRPVALSGRLEAIEVETELARGKPLGGSGELLPESQ